MTRATTGWQERKCGWQEPPSGWHEQHYRYTTYVPIAKMGQKKCKMK
jgi:hypothetical protein